MEFLRIRFLVNYFIPESNPISRVASSSKVKLNSFTKKSWTSFEGEDETTLVAFTSGKGIGGKVISPFSFFTTLSINEAYGFIVYIYCHFLLVISFYY